MNETPHEDHALNNTIKRIALWAPWSHTGVARAAVPTEVLVINVGPFGQTLMAERITWVIVQDFCATLMEVLVYNCKRMEANYNPSHIKYISNT